MPRSPFSDPDRRQAIVRSAVRWGVLLLVLAGAWALGWRASVPVVSVLCRIFVWIAGTLLGVWLLWRLYQRLLWRVSGRLAFSYFLIGVLPIPLAATLLLLLGYLVSGFFLGHVYRDALGELELQIETAAARAAQRPVGELTSPLPLAELRSAAEEGSGGGASVAVAGYRGGRRVAGDERAPESWPAWLAEGSADARPRYSALPDGSMTIASAVPGAAEGSGVIAFYDGDLGELLREASGVWVSALRNVEEAESTRVSIGGAGFHVRTDPLSAEEAADLEARKQAFFDQRAPGGAEEDDWRDRPLLSWVEVEEPARQLASGRSMGGEIAVLLTATPRILATHLFSPSAELSRYWWIALISVSLLLLAIYAVAELVALAMIFGISRAVSRLYGATSRVASGDFSVRIPVRRRDQVGALQRSFNGMAESLEDLVATVAQKELIDKELQMARQVQQSLIPKDLPSGETIEFSTLFEPSAAIGGDYFDVLRLSEDAVAVVVADVSGHGLPTGLRMAMVKAALGILVAEIDDPEEILRRLDATVRSDATGDESRFFVTAVFSRVDFRAGVVEVTNAGHPPVYLLRDGEVEEIMLPSSPLGGLGRDYAGRRVELVDGDVMVWLSDGLFEATGPGGEPFGYGRLEAALAGPAPSATAVRDRLLGAIEQHTEGRPAADDRTLVVMRYRTGGAPRSVSDRD